MHLLLRYLVQTKYLNALTGYNNSGSMIGKNFSSQSILYEFKYKSILKLIHRCTKLSENLGVKIILLFVQKRKLSTKFFILIKCLMYLI